MPQFYDPRFAKSTANIARADLMGTRNLKAKMASPVDASVDAFSRMLNGTWVRRATHNGVIQQTNSYWYFDMQGAQGTSMMINRENIGSDDVKEFADRAPEITYLHHGFFICDKYVKISGQKPSVVEKVNNVPLGQIPLEDAWKRLLAADFLDLPKVDPQWFQRIQPGLEPGAETNLPYIVGGYWKVTLQPAQGVPESQGHPGVAFKLSGEIRDYDYLAPNELSTLASEEGANFYQEADWYVTLPTVASGYKVMVGTPLQEAFKWDRVVIGPSPGRARLRVAAREPEFGPLKAVLQVTDSH